MYVFQIKIFESIQPLKVNANAKNYDTFEMKISQMLLPPFAFFFGSTISILAFRMTFHPYFQRNNDDSQSSTNISFCFFLAHSLTCSFFDVVGHFFPHEVFPIVDNLLNYFISFLVRAIVSTVWACDGRYSLFCSSPSVSFHSVMTHKFLNSFPVKFFDVQKLMGKLFNDISMKFSHPFAVRMGSRHFVASQSSKNYRRSKKSNRT